MVNENPNELRPKAVPRPTAPSRGTLPASQLPGDGRPPLQAGKVYMSEFVQQQLKAVGWKPGDPIPGDLGQRLKEIQHEVMEEQANARLEGSELAANWKPVESSFVKIDELPPAKQEEIRQYLQEYKADIAQQTEFARQQQAADDSIPDNVQGPQRELMRDQILQGDAATAEWWAKRQQQGDPVSTVIDDRKTAKAATPPPGITVPEGKKFAGIMGQSSVADNIEKAAQRQREYEKSQREQPAVTPVKDTTIPDAGSQIEHTNCQRCNWPLSKPFDIEPTVGDKQGFMAAILGLGRFEKEYSLLGDQLKVCFRSLSTSESSLLQRQLGTMVRSGDIHGDGEYWANLMEYRLVMSISRLEHGGNVIYAVKPVEEWDKEYPPTSDDVIQVTPIPRMLKYFYEHGATQEPLRRILGQTHRRFQGLVEALEAVTSDPDFWTGIELPV